MSSRAARKILKERELAAAQAALLEKRQQQESGSSEDEAFVAAPVRKNAFAMLMDDEDEVEEEEEEEEEEEQEREPTPPPPPKAKPKKKKSKSKKTNNNNDTDDFSRLVDEATAQLGAAEPVAVSEASSSKTKPQRALFAIDLKRLDAAAEMRRLFGSKTIADEARIRGGRNTNQQRRMMLNPTVGKTYLVTPKEQWPRMPQSVGITMTMLESPSKPPAPKSPGYFEFTYNPTYASIQAAFLQCVNTHDPGTINNLLQHYPFHIDALLQSSEIAKANNNISLAAEYIERALFVFERAFHPLFNLATANSILPYTYAENRAFLLALSRHISFVSRKGCWRTCLELSKLLYSCDPDEDPLGALQMMDWFALKAGEFEWVKRWWEEVGGGEGNVEGLPNWNFAVALAEFEGECASSLKDETHTKSTHLLESALKLYPGMIPHLYSKLTITDPTVTTSPLFSPFAIESCATESERLSHTAVDLLLQLYTLRSHHLWKEPTALAWLRATVTRLAVSTPESDPDLVAGRHACGTVYPRGLPLNVSRHVYTSDFGELVPFLPAEAMALRLDAFDPMPPPGEEEEGGEEGGLVGFGWLVDRLRAMMGARGEQEEEEEEEEEEGEWENDEEVD
ncbi:Transcription factor 25 [Podochytrium sp. JEL0797]|nr:Transcription factor 25 [Podochytrium sp. JEL0797]